MSCFIATWENSSILRVEDFIPAETRCITKLPVIPCVRGPEEDSRRLHDSKLSWFYRHSKPSPEFLFGVRSLNALNGIQSLPLAPSSIFSALLLVRGLILSP
ncbi:hypothetical protein PM082_023770 [Marasmius tenuissimus]|nr:hypothetical protein PM082_023770 [Marasmius tenuissimus]